MCHGIYRKKSYYVLTYMSVTKHKHQHATITVIIYSSVRMIFVALSYARARLGHRRRICPSVCPSHVGTDSN